MIRSGTLLITFPSEVGSLVGRQIAKFDGGKTRILPKVKKNNIDDELTLRWTFIHWPVGILHHHYRIDSDAMNECRCDLGPSCLAH